MKEVIFFTKLFQILGVVALAVLIYYTFSYGTFWILISFLYYKIVVGLLGNQIAQHRYFSHNSFKTTKSKHVFLSCVSITTGINPVLYASIHRHHHNHSDSVNDPHSPHVSLTGSLISWSNNFSQLRKIKPAFDLLRDPIISKVNKFGYRILTALIIIIGLTNWKIAVFIILAGMGWNYLHMNLFRTTLVHVKLPESYRNFDTTDQSWNNKFIQVLDLGEGLHNNHHKYPNRYNQAIMPGEFDPAGWIVKKFFLTVDNK
jgi:fatty-acid desaturase